MYVRPLSIDEALDALAGGEALPVCGGTDVFPSHVGRSVNRHVVDISAVAGLRGIRFDGIYYRIGGGTTWSDVQTSDLPPAFDGLKAAARGIGAVQIQNRSTIAGNLCNASPAADGVPPLLTLDAEVELRSVRGRRVMPVADFIAGYRKTVLLPDELLSAVLVRAPAPGAASGFFKLGARRYLVISILMAATLIERDEQGRISRAAVAVGAASPVAQRLAVLESDLAGLEPGVAPSSIVSPRHVAGLSPIDDVRATAAYRLEAAITVVGEALDRAAGGLAGG